MVEGSFKTVDPLAYHVNNVEDFDPEIVKACKNKDTLALGQLASKGDRGKYDIFICAHKQWHGFVLCVPANVNAGFEEILTDVIKTPFDVPGVLLCFTFELCYDNQQLRTYKIAKTFSLFKDIKEKIKRSYFIGHYEGITPSGLQIAAIRSAPHRYAVLLKDCVEFSKEFCIQALRVSTNGREIEKEVNKNIKAASASGFSFEYLSRNVRSSAWFGNFMFGGADVGSAISEAFSRQNSTCIACCVVGFILVYPVFVVLFYHCLK